MPARLKAYAGRFCHIRVTRCCRHNRKQTAYFPETPATRAGIEPRSTRFGPPRAPGAWLLQNIHRVVVTRRGDRHRKRAHHPLPLDLGRMGLHCKAYCGLSKLFFQINSGRWRAGKENSQSRGAKTARDWLSEVWQTTLFGALFARFFAAALASQRLFNTFLFAGLQVKGVAFDLFDDVFLLHFALEAAQRIFKRLALLDANFCQNQHPPTSLVDVIRIAGTAAKVNSQGRSCGRIALCQRCPSERREPVLTP